MNGGMPLTVGTLVPAMVVCHPEVSHPMPEIPFQAAGCCAMDLP